MLLMGDVTKEELYDNFKEQSIALEKGGADIIIIETMTDLDEASFRGKSCQRKYRLYSNCYYDFLEET
jgi:methionine synthase I (cobalamin-dependent)